MTAAVHGGVAVGAYLPRTGGNIMNAIAIALSENSQERLRLVLPMGNHEVTRTLTEADGLRSNLTFDGLDPISCRLYKNGNGQMFLWQNTSPSGVAFRGMELAFPTTTQNYNASINLSLSSDVLVENMRFTCGFAGETENGIYHGVQLLGGTNLRVRNCYFERTQAVLCGLGRYSHGVLVHDNVFKDCNDLGVSCVSSDGYSLKDIKVCDNRFSGVVGAGYIYVGSDGGGGENPDMQDVIIDHNICTGTLDQSLVNGARQGIVVSLGDVNKRIKVRGNIVANDNPGVGDHQATGITVFLRDGTSTGTEDLEVSGNSVDWRTADTRAGINVSGTALRGVRVEGNQIAAGSRGMTFGHISVAQITGNVVHGSTSSGLLLHAPDAAMSDIELYRNHIETVGAFKAAIQVSGAHSISRCRIERNRLISGQNSIINGLTGGATFGFYYARNSHTAGLHASATPLVDESSSNVTEAA